MKKLFISVPMKGRTQENIQRSREFLHKYAELIVGEELEVIDSYIDVYDAPFSAHDDIYYLGLSISKMADADYFVGIDYGSELWHGCDIEHSVAQSYGIPWFCVSWERLQAFADMHKVRDDYYRRMTKTCSINGAATVGTCE